MENKEWMHAMQELRRSNASVPKPSGKRYKRRARTQRNANTE